jgi:hydrogenase nickel incorporation protein HypA/HybF
MHELSIVLSMIEEIEEHSRAHDGAAIETIYVRIGILSGVDVQALRFAFELASEDTSLAASRLEIETVPLLVHCPQCDQIHSPDIQRILCPRCLTPQQEILEGRELQLRALELAA